MDVIKALWHHQCRNNVILNSVHSDSGTQFRNIGDLGTNEESDESLRLLLLLEAQSISTANGQKLNAAEPAIKRIKVR